MSFLGLEIADALAASREGDTRYYVHLGSRRCGKDAVNRQLQLNNTVQVLVRAGFTVRLGREIFRRA